MDCRWDVLASCLDDRTAEERGLEVQFICSIPILCLHFFKPLKNDKFVMPKSRYDTISCYIHQKSAAFNDTPFPFDEEIMKKLQANGKHFSEILLSCLCFIAGFDEQLARHFAYLFIRDPVSVFEELLQQDPEKETDHFEV